MFPVTVTLTNPTQLNAVMAALNIGQIDTAPAGAVVSEAKAEKRKAEPKTDKPTTETTTPTADTNVKDAVQMTAAQAEKALDGHANKPADAPTYQDAAAAITNLAKAKGRDAAMAVLAKFKAAKLPDVKPEQFADVIAAATEAGA